MLAQALGGVPMRVTVPFLVLPALAALAALAYARALAFTEPAPRTRELQNLLRRGALAGILATLAYDLIRPPMRWAFGFEYDPFGAVYLFGDLMTGRPGSSLALLAGWAFHAIDGISFGIIFALMVPRGGVIPGLAAGALLQGLLMLSYPALVGVPVNDAGFLAMGIIGHAVFGTVLGATVRRSGAAGRARAPALAIATHDQV